MSKFACFAAVLFAFGLLATTTESAEAQGVHFRTGRLHVDVGNPHGGFGHHGHHGTFGHQVRHGGWGHGYSSCYPSWGWGGGHSWHDTSHYDWHPTEWRRHGNHWHVQPGHWDWHQEGHVDHHHP